MTVVVQRAADNQFLAPLAQQHGGLQRLLTQGAPNLTLGFSVDSQDSRYTYSLRSATPCFAIWTRTRWRSG